MKRLLLITLMIFAAKVTFAQVSCQAVSADSGTNSTLEETVEAINLEAQNASLFAMIRAKNLKGVEEALNNKADVNAILKDRPYLSAASYAIQFGTPEILKLLLQREANPNLRNDNVQTTTPLIEAVKLNTNSVAFIDVLLAPPFTADINLAAAGGRTPLHFASTHHNVAAIERLVKDSRIDLNAKSFAVFGPSDTALSSMIFFGDVAAMKALFNHPDTTKPMTLKNLNDAELSLHKDPALAAAQKTEIDAYRKKHYPNN